MQSVEVALIWFAISEYLPSFPSTERYARLPLPYGDMTSPQWVPWASVPHLPGQVVACPSVLWSAKTAYVPSPVASLLARSRVPCSPPLICVLGGDRLYRSPLGRRLPTSARSLDPTSTPSLLVFSARRTQALPSSRATPVETCPALRPRWCPSHLPYRNQDCCLPATQHRRLSLIMRLLTTTVHISGFDNAACALVSPGFVRPLLGLHAGFTTALLARRCAGGT